MQYCDKCGGVIVDIESECRCNNKPGNEFVYDGDIFIHKRTGKEYVWEVNRMGARLHEYLNHNNMKCKTCIHYSLFLMITTGPYGYSGDIPCLRCSSYISLMDQYVPVSEIKKDGDKWTIYKMG